MQHTFKMLISGYFRRRKKEWKSLSFVVFFCVIFFITIISSCLDAISSIEQYTKYQYGSHQFQVFGANKDHKAPSGASIGSMELKGYFINEVSLYYDAIVLGVVNDDAKTIGHLAITKGKIPEKKGEIAIESSVLKRMDIDATVGDEIHLPVYWVKDGEYQLTASEETFTITGIIKDYSRIWMQEASEPTRQYPGIWLSEQENYEQGIRVELLQLDEKVSPEQQEQYYQYLTGIYGERAVVTYNQNILFATEDDSAESVKSTYLSVASIIMGCAIIIIMLVGIVSIMSLGIEERKKQQKILYQLGLNKKQCFYILCGQIFGASLIGILPGVLVSFILSKGLKMLLYRMLGIFVPDETSYIIIVCCILLILLTIGISNILIYGMIHQDRAKPLKKSKIPDYIQRICNGTFHTQRVFSILLLLATLLIILPVQVVIGYYQDYFSHPLEKDVNIYLNSMAQSGALAISEGRQGITLKDYERLNQLSGLEDMTYVIQLESAKILLPSSEREEEFLKYRSSEETVAKIENPDLGDGKDYLKRDKVYYGYPEESCLVQCTIQGIEWDVVENLSSYMIGGKLNKNAYSTGEEVLAVVWEEEYGKAEYPIHVADEITLSNLVLTKESENYWKKPDEAERVDVTTKVGGIMKVPLELADALGCNSVRGSYTFLRSVEALKNDGHDISFQNISYNYGKNADMRSIDDAIKEILSTYSFVNYNSKYEQIQAEQQFKNVVYILAGSIWGLGLCLAILLMYQKIISTLILKKRQLHMMWCMGMHKERLGAVVRKESYYCVGYALLIALIVSAIVSKLIQSIALEVAAMFIVGSSIVAFVILNYLLRNWVKRFEI